MSLLDNMPHKCSIDRPRHVNDAWGANREEDASVATGTACWAQNASQSEINEFQKRDQSVTHKVYFPAEPPLRVGDHITITTAEAGMLGLVLKFQAAADRSAGLGVLFAAMCQEETNPRFAAFIP